MELRSSFVLKPPQVQFDKQLLHLLNQKENIEARAILERNPDFLQIIDRDGCTLLHHAAKHNNEYIALYLCDKGVNVNAQDGRGRTALMSASSHPEGASLTQALLLTGTYVHSRDNDGKSVLQMILEKHVPKLAIAEFCVRNLIAFYSKDYDTLAKFYLECKNPLLHLIWAKNPTLTRSLLQQGYPVNATICHTTGKKALHVAVYHCDLDHVKILVECGADVNAKNKSDATPLGLYDASHRGFKEMLEILRILLDRGALTTAAVTKKEFGIKYMPVKALLLRGGKEEIRLLRQYNLNLRATDLCLHTPLHILSFNECENIFEELLGMDFDVHAKDYKGRTPLHYAVANRSSVDFLLKNGADVNALDEEGYTPLHHAFLLDNQYPETDLIRTCNIRSIELLLESGADPQAISYDKTTVVQEAVDNIEFIAIKPLLAHLAILAVRGVVLEKRIQKQITRDSRLSGVFNFYAKKLMQIKTVEIWESVTLYDLLMESEEKLAVYMRNTELVLKLAHISIKYKTRLNYYHRFIRRRGQKILQKAQVKGRAAVFIWKLVKFQYEANPIISDAIVNYLDYKDLLNLLQL